MYTKLFLWSILLFVVAEWRTERWLDQTETQDPAIEQQIDVSSSTMEECCGGDIPPPPPPR